MTQAIAAALLAVFAAATTPPQATQPARKYVSDNVAKLAIEGTLLISGYGRRPEEGFLYTAAVKGGIERLEGRRLSGGIYDRVQSAKYSYDGRLVAIYVCTAHGHKERAWAIYATFSDFESEPVKIAEVAKAKEHAVGAVSWVKGGRGPYEVAYLDLDDRKRPRLISARQLDVDFDKRTIKPGAKRTMARELKIDEQQWRGVTMGMSAVGRHWTAGVQGRGCYWTVPDPANTVVTPQTHNWRPAEKLVSNAGKLSRDGRYVVAGFYFGQEQYFGYYPPGPLGEGKGRKWPSVKIIHPFLAPSMPPYRENLDKYVLLVGPPHNWLLPGVALVRKRPRYESEYGDPDAASFTHFRSWSNHPRFLVFCSGLHRRDANILICELAAYPPTRDAKAKGTAWHDRGDYTWYEFATQHLKLPNKPDLDLWVTKAPDDAKWLDGASWRNPAAVPQGAEAK
jgi:hypothetical protein